MKCQACEVALMGGRNFSAPFYSIALTARGGTITSLKYSVSDISCLICGNCYRCLKPHIRTLSKVAFEPIATNGGTGICLSVDTRSGFQGAVPPEHKKILHFVSIYAGNIFMPEVCKALFLREPTFTPLSEHLAQNKLETLQRKSRYEIIQEAA